MEYYIKHKILLKEVNQSYLLIDLTIGKTYKLNNSAGKIVSMISKEVKIDDMVLSILDEYNIDPKSAREMCIMILEELVKKKVIVIN